MKLDELVNYFMEEFNMTPQSIVGVLEMKKASVIAATFKVLEARGDDDDAEEIP